MMKQQQHPSPVQEEGGEDEHRKRKTMTNPFRRSFSKHPSSGSSSNIPLQLPNIILPSIHLPDILSFPMFRMFSKLNSHDKYQRVEDFDVGLAKDVEEALLLVDNDRASVGGSLSGGGGGNKNSVFGSDSWESDETPQRHHQGETNNNVNRRESHFIVRGVKPSLFHETNNAAHQKVTRLGQRDVVDAQSDTYDVVAREAKPSLFQETNAAGASKKHPHKASRHHRINALSINNNFVNVADVKENYSRRRNSFMGDDQIMVGLNEKISASSFDGSDVLIRNTKNRNTQNAMRHDTVMSTTQHEVDAATAAAQTAWDNSLHFYAMNRSRSPQQQDTKVDRGQFSSPDSYVRYDSYGVVEDEDGERDDFSHHDHPNISATANSVTIGETNQAHWWEENGQSAHGTDDEASVGKVIGDGSLHCNTRSRRIFITERALALAQSLRFDVRKIFQFKMNVLNLDIDSRRADIENFTVTENDVREYLDRRYEKLMLRMSMNNLDQHEALRKRAIYPTNPLRKPQNTFMYP